MTVALQPPAAVFLAPRVMAWSVFLVLLVFVWAVPTQSSGKPAGIYEIASALFSVLLFSGLFVVAGLEFLIACLRHTTRNSKAIGIFALFVLLLPVTYYMAAVSIAHLKRVQGILVLGAWLLLLASAGAVIKRGLPGKCEAAVVSGLLVVGGAVLVSANLFWSLYYTAALYPSRIHETPFWALIGGFALWAALAISYWSASRWCKKKGFSRV